VTATAFPPASATRGRAADPHATRAASLAALEAEPFDLLVVGGGITGAGVARDAARRGLRVALVERDDFAAGTSSRSSRLVHGGVRYLEHGHLGLVFEASRERRILLRTAPHLVRPLASPGRSTAARASRAGSSWPASRSTTRWRSSATSRCTARSALPACAPRSRRSPTTAWSAARATGTPRPTTRASRSPPRSTRRRRRGRRQPRGGAHARAARPRRPGARRRRGSGAAPSTVRARVVVNAAGPWADRVRRLAEPGAPDIVLGAKGVHVAVPAERVGNRGAVTLLSPLDGRVMFALPAGPCTILGTTETPAERGPDEVRATEADVAYLLRSANHFFPVGAPHARRRRERLGGHPPARRARRAGRGGTGSASREHVIERDARGLVTVSGGKLTTYRAMAAQIVDAALSLLPGEGPRRGADTDTRPLPGGDMAADEMTQARRTIGDDAIATRLVQAHGTRWRDVWALTTGDPSLAGRVVPALPYTGAELVHAVRDELACTLADLLVRRTPIAFETRDAGRGAARAAAPIVAAVLGWDDATTQRALADYDRESERLFGIDA
jgi:glycerol-3-phosphate dehydrogenase